MMTKTLKTAFRLCILIPFSFQIAHSQTQLSGSVADAAGKPLPAATVLLLNGTDSTLVKGQISATDGSYSFETVEPGNYRLGVSMLGFASYFSDVFALQDQTEKKDLGKVQLQENAEQLEEVSVVAKRPLFEQKIDRLVVNVATSVTSAGSNALEVLQRSPGVLVNRGGGWINMSGKNGVLVMINGKISRLPSSAIIQLLEGMNADNIERIELIHTPPANFDAEGNAGIINIVLKKNADDGLNGSYSLSAGYGMKEKAGANLNFNYRHDKINLYGDYSWNYDNNPQVFSNYRSIEQNGNILETNGVSDRDPTRTHTQNGRLGLDIQLSPKTVLGGLAGWMDRYWTMDAFNTVTLKENGAPTGFVHIPNDEINHWRHYLGNLNLEHQFTKDQKINLDLDYAYYDFNNPSNYTNRYLDAGGALLNETQLRVRKTTPMSILASKADFTRQFGEKATLEAGLKGTMTRFNNDVTVEDLVLGGWVTNPDYTADYSMEEDIGAAYSAVTLKLNDKTDMKAGLRYEFTRSNLGSAEQPDIVDRQYGNLFPSLFLSRKIDKNNTLQFSYSRRINRPNFMQLAPYFIFYDPTTIETGNPKLQPSIVDGVKTDYMWKSVQLSLQYSYEDDVIIQGQPEVDPVTNRQVNGAVNYDYAKTASATLTFPVRPFNWWEMQVSASGQWQEYKGIQNGLVSKLALTNWYGFVSQSFRLPKQYTIELSAFYFSGGPYGKTVGRPLGEVNIGFQKELGGNRGTLRFNVSDVFLTAIWTSTIDDPEQNFYYRGQYRQTERIFRLTYSNKFGSNKVKDARRRATGSEEERRRVN
ncbi:MAG: TonB-dependent receptor [Saprospiraceae bacterium]|nr:TonB-dependent receptor [Saprospiraceae bacterium]